MSGESTRRSSGHVAAAILVSRVTGLVRERALGHYLGTSGAADAFTVAFRLPNLLQHLLGEGVLSASFIPVYSRLLAAGRHEEAGRVAGAVAGLLAVATGVLALLGILLAELLTLLVAAGLRARPETFGLTVDLVRIMFPAVGFLVMSAWCLGVLNSHRRFFLSYVAPALLNVVQVVVLVAVGSTLLTVSRTGSVGAVQDGLVRWLAAGTVAGGLLQFLVQLPTVLRLSRGLRPSLRTDLPGVRETLRTFGPVVASRGVVQVSAYLQVFLASFLAAGALSTLRYAQVLYLLPISLFAMSVAAAELPRLSTAGTEVRQRVLDRLDAGSARIAAFVVPTAVGYLLVGDHITAALFETGRFSRVDTIAVWLVLAGYTVGMLASSSSRLLQSSLFGIGDPRTPSRVAIVRVVLSVALGVVLMLQLDRVAVSTTGLQLLGDLPAFTALPPEARDDGGDVLRLGAVGLALAGGVAAWLEYVLLRRAVRRSIGRTRMGGGQLGRILAATAVAGVVVVLARPMLDGLAPLVAGLVAVVVIAGVYAPVATALGVTEARVVWRLLRRGLGRLGRQG